MTPEGDREPGRSPGANYPAGAAADRPQNEYSLVSAPEGIALTSGEHLQVSAGHNLIATAGKNADVSVVKNLFIGVGSALSVFVRKLGIRLIANQVDRYRCRRRMI